MVTKVLVEVELHEDDAEDIRKGCTDTRNAVMLSVNHGHFEIISMSVEKDKPAS